MRERASGGPSQAKPARNHQSSHSFATRVHGFATKTNALAHEIPPATQASKQRLFVFVWTENILKTEFFENNDVKIYLCEFSEVVFFKHKYKVTDDFCDLKFVQHSVDS